MKITWYIGGLPAARRHGDVTPTPSKDDPLGSPTTRVDDDKENQHAKNRESTRTHDMRTRGERLGGRHPWRLAHPLLIPEAHGLGRTPSCVDYDGAARQHGGATHHGITDEAAEEATSIWRCLTEALTSPEAARDDSASSQANALAARLARCLGAKQVSIATVKSVKAATLYLARIAPSPGDALLLAGGAHEHNARSWRRKAQWLVGAAAAPPASPHDTAPPIAQPVGRTDPGTRCSSGVAATAPPPSASAVVGAHSSAATEGLLALSNPASSGPPHLGEASDPPPGRPQPHLATTEPGTPNLGMDGRPIAQAAFSPAASDSLGRSLHTGDAVTVKFLHGPLGGATGIFKGRSPTGSKLHVQMDMSAAALDDLLRGKVKAERRLPSKGVHAPSRWVTKRCDASPTPCLIEADWRAVRKDTCGACCAAASKGFHIVFQVAAADWVCSGCDTPLCTACALSGAPTCDCKTVWDAKPTPRRRVTQADLMRPEHEYHGDDDEATAPTLPSGGAPRRSPTRGRKTPPNAQRRWWERREEPRHGRPNRTHRPPGHPDARSRTRPTSPGAANRSSEAMGSHNPSMDGSPRAQDPEEEGPVAHGAVSISAPQVQTEGIEQQTAAAVTRLADELRSASMARHREYSARRADNSSTTSALHDNHAPEHGELLSLARTWLGGTKDRAIVESSVGTAARGSWTRSPDGSRRNYARESAEVITLDARPVPPGTLVRYSSDMLANLGASCPVATCQAEMLWAGGARFRCEICGHSIQSTQWQRICEDQLRQLHGPGVRISRRRTITVTADGHWLPSPDATASQPPRRRQRLGLWAGAPQAQPTRPSAPWRIDGLALATTTEAPPPPPPVYPTGAARRSSPKPPAQPSGSTLMPPPPPKPSTRKPAAQRETAAAPSDSRRESATAAPPHAIAVFRGGAKHNRGRSRLGSSPQGPAGRVHHTARLSGMRTHAIEVGGGGDCCYRSVAAQLGRYGYDPDRFAEVRATTAGYVLEHQDSHEPFLTNRPWSEFVSDIAESGVWLETGIELQAIASAHKIDLLIIDVKEVGRDAIFPGAHTGCEVIYLAYWRGVHYRVCAADDPEGLRRLERHAGALRPLSLPTGEATAAVERPQPTAPRNLAPPSEDLDLRGAEWHAAAPHPASPRPKRACPTAWSLARAEQAMHAALGAGAGAAAATGMAQLRNAPHTWAATLAWDAARAEQKAQTTLGSVVGAAAATELARIRNAPPPPRCPATQLRADEDWRGGASDPPPCAICARAATIGTGRGARCASHAPAHTSDGAPRKKRRQAGPDWSADDSHPPGQLAPPAGSPCAICAGAAVSGSGRGARCDKCVWAGHTPSGQDRTVKMAAKSATGRFVYFHHQDGRHGCFSQFARADFKDGRGNAYTCAEQYMMAEKARVMDDGHTLARIMECGYDPDRIKALGRAIQPWIQSRWEDHRYEVVLAGNLLKFAQNHKLLSHLLSTGDHTLAEAAPYDRIWGIGISVDAAESGAAWRGENLLGKALMQARTQLSQTPKTAPRPATAHPPPPDRQNNADGGTEDPSPRPTPSVTTGASNDGPAQAPKTRGTPSGPSSPVAPKDDALAAQLEVRRRRFADDAAKPPPAVQAKRVAWTGGTIVSNKQEATAAFQARSHSPSRKTSPSPLGASRLSGEASSVAQPGPPPLIDHSTPGDACVPGGIMRHRLVTVGSRDDDSASALGATHVWVDRTTALGNPFTMGDGSNDEALRDAACDAFDAMLAESFDADLAEIAREFQVPICARLASPEAAAARRDAMTGLTQRARGGEALHLRCHCHPRRCHAHAIAARISRDAAPATWQPSSGGHGEPLLATARPSSSDYESAGPEDMEVAQAQDTQAVGDTTRQHGTDAAPAPPADQPPLLDYRSPPGQAVTLPTIDVEQLAAHPRDSILLVPVITSSAAADGNALAFVPLEGGAVFGIDEGDSRHRRNGRREAAVDAAGAVVTAAGLNGSLCFLAAEIDLGHHKHTLGNDASRTSVVAMPCSDAAGTFTIHSGGVWVDIPELATACNSAAGTARYRAAFVAINQADAHTRSTIDAPGYARTGARAAANASAPRGDGNAAPISIGERVAQAHVASAELRTALLAIDADTEPGFAEFCGAMADQTWRCGPDLVPEELLSIMLPAAPDDLLERKYSHKAQIVPHEVTPPPPDQTDPPDGWWPHSVRDILEPWALEGIQDWMSRCVDWHKGGGGGASRPGALAYGADAIKEPARGRRWDLRHGDGDVRLWRGYTAEERQARTCINLAVAKDLLADCVDKEAVDFLLHGVRFRPGLSDQVVLMPNLLSMYTAGGVSAAAAQASDMTRSGFIALFDSIPSVPYRAVPRGLVAKHGTEEKRGIADQGAPRKTLRTQRSNEPVESLNDLCRAAGWAHEDKDTLENAAHNGAIVQAIGDAGGEFAFEVALDLSKWFHRVFYDPSELWQQGALVPDQTSGELKFAIEMAMSMGSTHSSQVAQRLANIIVQEICKAMDAQEEAHRLTSPLRAAQQEIIDARSRLAPDSYSTQGRAYDMMVYTDDLRGVCAGVARTVRLLRAIYGVLGPSGLNAPLSRVEKQQVGAAVTWLGGCTAAGIGVVFVPADKAVRALHGIDASLRGDMEVADYRRLTGFLVSILFMLGDDKTLLSHIWRPMKPRGELEQGPATLVWPDPMMTITLSRWRLLLSQFSGCAAMQAVRPGMRHNATVKYRLRTDAALANTPQPGLGGAMHGLWWSVAIADEPVLQRMDIPHLELMAACVGILTYEPMLRDADRVSLETDALATAVALTKRARTPVMQTILDALHEQDGYVRLAPRLEVQHLSGAANFVSDGASRGYFDTIRAIGAALGVETKRIDISAPARGFIERVTALLSLQPGLGDLGEVQPPGGLTGATAPGMGNPNMAPTPFAQASPGAPPPPSLGDNSRVRHQRGHRAGSAASAPGLPPRSPTRAAPPDARGPLPGPRTPPSRSAVAPPAVKRHAGTGGSAWATAPRAAGAAPQSPTAPQARRSIGGTLSDESLRPGHTQPATRPSAELSPGRPPPPPIASSALSGVPRLPLGGARSEQPRDSELSRAREKLADRAFNRLRYDTSDYALRADDAVLHWVISVAQGDPGDQPVTTQSNQRSNWRHWERWCAHVGTSTWRPDLHDVDAVGYEREQQLWAAGLMFIYENMQPKKGNVVRSGPWRGFLQPPLPRSALAVLRGVRKEHLDRGITPPPLTMATRRMNEAMRRYASWIGAENMAPRRKATLSHELIVGMLEVPDDQVGSAPTGHGVEGDLLPDGRRRAASTDDIDVRRRGKHWRWVDDFGVSIRALIHVLSQTGFRKAEVALGNEPWGMRHISFANVQWFLDGTLVTNPTAAQLRGLKTGDYAVVVPPPSKADPWGQVWQNHPIYLPWHPTARLNAARELAKWELRAAVDPSARRSTPLFCGTGGVGTPLGHGTLDAVFHDLLGYRIGKEAAKDYSVHSFRSFLASSMLAAKCSDAEIMAALRWSSKEALDVYKNANMETYGGWLLAAEQQKLTGLRLIELLPRVPQVDRIQLVAGAMGARERRDAVALAEDADRDRGCPLAAVALPDRDEPAWRVVESSHAALGEAWRLIARAAPTPGPGGRSGAAAPVSQ